MGACQNALHSWGRANQVSFDSAKESKHILSRSRSLGGNFKLLGVSFDSKLLMAEAVADLAKNSRWKLKAILRTRAFNTGTQLMTLYKTQLLPFIEYQTAAIYHACSSSLALLDDVQAKLLAAAGVTPIEALVSCRLAPLSCRRDMALLGLIHRTVIGKGPRHFQNFFRSNGANEGSHRFQLEEFSTGDWTDYLYPGSRPAAYVRHSILGLVRVYNHLPAEIVENSSSVSIFQTKLQQKLTQHATGADIQWISLFSPR